MKLSAKDFKEQDSIEITNVRNIDQMEDSSSVLCVTFDNDKTWNRVSVDLDGVVIGANERFTFVNNWLKNNPSFDLVVDDEVRELEL